MDIFFELTNIPPPSSKQEYTLGKYFPQRYPFFISDSERIFLKLSNFVKSCEKFVNITPSFPPPLSHSKEPNSLFSKSK